MIAVWLDAALCDGLMVINKLKYVEIDWIAIGEMIKFDHFFIVHIWNNNNSFIHCYDGEIGIGMIIIW